MVKQPKRNSRLAFSACLTIAIQLLVLINVASSQSSSSSSSSSITITSTTSLSSRLRPSRIRRPESCRDNLPRKSDDLPELVIVGRVKEVYLAGGNSGDQQQQQQQQQQQSPGQLRVAQSADGATTSNKALVSVGRVIRGNQQLVDSDIIISGFNSSTQLPCPNYVKPNDTLILLLNHDGDRKYTIQGNNLLAMNLNNLDRINAIALDEPLKRRGPIDDILCEAHYCPYGRCVVNERTNQTSCQCPDSCPPLPAPVCGSDNATYTNECHLIKEGCRRQKPLFVTKETSC